MKSIQDVPWFATTGFFLLCASPLAGPMADEPAYRSVEGRKLDKQFVQHSEMDLTSSKMSVEGPDGPQEQEGGDSSFKIIDDETIEMQDETVAAGKGRPAKLKRHFATIDNAVSFESDAEDFEAEPVKNVSGLLGKDVLFTWDDDEKEFAPAWFECEGEDDLLKTIVEDADFRGWLPGKKVEEDDTWTIDVAEFNNLQEPSGPMGYREEGEEAGEQDDAMSDGLRQNRKGEIKATYKGVREEGGVRVGVIAFEAKLATSFEVEKAEEGGASSKQSNEQTDELEGELLWNLAGGHFQSLTCDSKITMTRNEVQSIEVEDASFKLTQTQAYSGKKTYRFTCSEKKD